MVVAEGGVYLQGTIVSIDTEPKVVLTLLPGKFTGLVEWIVYLNAFDCFVAAQHILIYL